MSLVAYRPFLVWARNRPSELKILGDGAAKFDRSDDLTYRYAQLRAVGDATVRHLDHLCTASAGEIPNMPVDALEEEILDLVTAPIDTGADVDRETRDQAWLQRAFQMLNLLGGLLSRGSIDPPQAEEPAAETEVEPTDEELEEEERTIEEMDAADDDEEPTAPAP